MSESDKKVVASARRLRDLLSRSGPFAVVTEEVRVLVTRLAGLVGPVVIRRWLDELSDRTAAALSRPDASTPCPKCEGRARFYLPGGSVQCAACCGLGVV